MTIFLYISTCQSDVYEIKNLVKLISSVVIFTQKFLIRVYLLYLFICTRHSRASHKEANAPWAGSLGSSFVVNLPGGIAAYCYFPKKPSIRVQTVDISNDRQLTLFKSIFRRTHVKKVSATAPQKADMTLSWHTKNAVKSAASYRRQFHGVFFATSPFLPHSTVALSYILDIQYDT